MTSVGKRGPNPRFSPSPPRIFGDGAGTGAGLIKVLGNFWGWGWLQLWVFLGFYPRKSPKNFWGFLGDGDDFNFGVFWGFIPENPPKSFGDFLGTGMTSILGVLGSPKIPENFWGFLVTRLT